MAATIALNLTKDQLEIAMVSVRDGINWYRSSARNEDSKDLRAYYTRKANEYLALEEIFSDARKELINAEMKGSRK